MAPASRLSVLSAKIPGHGLFEAPAAVVEILDRKTRGLTLAELRQLVRQTTGVASHGTDPNLNRLELLLILADADPMSVRMLEDHRAAELAAEARVADLLGQVDRAAQDAGRARYEALDEFIGYDEPGGRLVGVDDYRPYFVTIGGREYRFPDRDAARQFLLDSPQAASYPPEPATAVEEV